MYYALKWVHNIVCINPETDPTENNLVKSILEAAKRRLSKPVAHKQVLPSDILVKLCVKYHDSVDIIELRDLALFILLFSGFLRFSEAQNLLCSDVKIFSTHLELKIRSSKTDLFRAGDVVPIARTETVSCPVSVVSRYIAAAHLDLNEDIHFFRPALRFGPRRTPSLVKVDKPLSYSNATEVFRKRFGEFLPNIGQFGLHSFRSGGASEAARRGVGDRCFKRHSRWRSVSAKDRYVSDSLQHRLAVTQNLGL